MNNWGIPAEIEKLVLKRDLCCVYCQVNFCNSKPSKENRKFLASWEHVINDVEITTPENIVRCCISCNSSKGSKHLKDWLDSAYCHNKNINISTVSHIIRQHVQKYW